MKTFYLLALLSFLAISSCTKKKDIRDTQSPVIIVNTPTNNQVFANGQTIVLTGSVSDNKTIAELHIHINDNNSGTELLHTHYDPNSPNTTFTESITAITGTQYRIEVLAVDADANESMEILFVSCN